MQRICPNCSVRAIPVAELLFGVCRCPNCQVDVRVNRFASLLFSLVIIAVTIATSLMVLSLFGVYAVILWFAFPIGAIGYLKTRYCPLTVVER
jgi:hypothetical protein